MANEPITVTYIKWDSFVEGEVTIENIHDLVYRAVQPIMDQKWNCRRTQNDLYGSLYGEYVGELAARFDMNAIKIGRRAGLHPIYVSLIMSKWLPLSRIFPGTSEKLARAFKMPLEDWASLSKP